MACLSDSQKDAQQYPSEQYTESSICTYINDEDFGKAFNNLLHPIEFSSKSNQYPLHQHNFSKELHSYLVHLNDSRLEGISLFVEAASMLKNINYIYLIIINQLYDDIMKLSKKLQNNEIYQKEITEEETIEEHNKRREKKIKFDSYSFEPIKPQVSKTLINFNCKLVNLSKKPYPPKIELNTNIKVHTLYTEILPYICTEKGEIIGKKYDFILNGYINCDFAVCEEFDYATNEYQKSINPVQIVSMDDDDCNSHQFYNEVSIRNLLSLPATDPGYVKDINDIPQIIDNDDHHDDNNDVPITQKKKKNVKRPRPLSSFTINDDLREELQKRPTTFDQHSDPVFMKLINETQHTMQIEKINNNEGTGIQDHDDCNLDDLSEPEESLNNVAGNLGSCSTFQTDMLEYNENQSEIMNENLSMKKRVQYWHDTLRPILEKEENRPPFDVHNYESRVLNCFKSIGEQKQFKDLVKGLDKEEVARYFISVLFMVNTYNLKILTSGPDHHQVITLELLNKDRHHDQLRVNITNILNPDLNC